MRDRDTLLQAIVATYTQSFVTLYRVKQIADMSTVVNLAE